MKTEVFVCKICDSEYNKEDRVPKILPRCGHTVCSSCIVKVLATKGQITCPVDEVVFIPQDKEINNFVTNMSILEALDATLVVEEQICTKHEEPCNFVCLTDKIRICEFCKLGEHKEHRMEKIDDVINEATLKRRHLEAQVRKFDKTYQKAKKFIDQEKKTMHKAVKERFAKLTQTLKAKEQEIQQEIEFGYGLEKAQVKTALNEKTALRNTMEKQIAVLKNFSFDEVFFEAFLDEVDSVSVSQEQIYPVKRAKELNQQLELALEGYENYLIEKIDRFQSTFPEKEYLERIDNADILKSETFNIMKIRTLLRFESRLGCLIITPRDTPQVVEGAMEVSPDIDQWKEITRVGLEFHRRNLTEEMIRGLHLLWSQFGEVTHLKVDLSNKEMNDKELISFCLDAFWTQESIEVFEMNLQGCQVREETLVTVLSGLISKMSNLKSLKLQLAETNVTDQAISIFAKDIEEIMSRLETLQLNLSNTGVTDLSVMQLFIAMPNVQIFTLNLSNTKVRDQSIEALAEHSLSTMKGLERFELYLFNTKVSDNGIIPIFIEMPHVKRYALGLSNTKISDKCLEVFSNQTLSSMGELESLELYFSDTKITDNGAIQLFVGMESIKTFILGLSNTEITDATVETLAEHTMKTFKALEVFEVYLLNNEITDKGAIQLFVNMETVKKFKLGLSYTDVTDQFIETFALDALPEMKKLETLELYLACTEVTDEGLVQLFPSIITVKQFILDVSETSVGDESIEVLQESLGNMKLLKSLDIQVETTQVTQEGKVLLEQLKKKFL